MYAGSGFDISELGDIDVLQVDGLYHLFHLVLPNHDYIAHAVSNDGLVWRRVQNALFIGDPGAWDDDMLWTMHITPDPTQDGVWRMFYTGLSRRESGRVQRIGLARSHDLYHWEKDMSGRYPLQIQAPHYESSKDEGRQWVSCRDPYYYRENGQGYLLVNGRVAEGPVFRRGCVAVAKEVEPDTFEWLPPMFIPRMYDDVEVPGLYKLGGRYYLLGNMREDVKVHYWHSDSFDGPYEAFSDNVLMPQGNYAARVMRQGRRLLVWNFFMNYTDLGGKRLLPPPKEIVLDNNGRLRLQSAENFNQKANEPLPETDIFPIQPFLANPTATAKVDNGTICIASTSGYEIYCLSTRLPHYRLSGRLWMTGAGKCGLIARGDEHTNGYYISLDLYNGFAQIRIWSEVPRGQSLDENRYAQINMNSFRYHQLQENHFKVSKDLKYQFELVIYGGYIEFSIDGQIVLSLIDVNFSSNTMLGFYTESAEMRIEQIKLEELNGPEYEDYGPM